MQDSDPPPGSPGSSPPPQQSASNFFGKLFDLNFNEFITLSIIKVIYVLLIVFAGLGALGILVSFIAQGGGAAVAGVILAPILFLLYVILARVWLEILIVIFRIAENTTELVRQGRGDQ